MMLNRVLTITPIVMKTNNTSVVTIDVGYNIELVPLTHSSERSLCETLERIRELQIRDRLRSTVNYHSWLRTDVTIKTGQLRHNIQ